MGPLGTDRSAVEGSDELVAGRVVANRYRLVAELGRGAMGVVWSAVNLSTSEERALKIVVEPDASLRRRLMREGRVCKDLRHPHVAEVYDVGETAAGQPFLVMERLRGETLADALSRSKSLPGPTAAAIARDVANAVAAAHALGVVHRDLKPANIYLHRSPGVNEVVVKVLDFGVCKVQESGDEARTELGVPVGSLAYMAPEQAAGEADIDGRADVWSLGVVLFEMLAGRRLFSGSRMNLIRALLYDPLPSFAAELRGADPGLPAIVERCLSREREGRFASASELSDALEEVCSHAEQREGPRTRVSFAERPETTSAIEKAAPRGLALGSFRLVSAPSVSRPVDAAPPKAPAAKPPPLDSWPEERAVVSRPAPAEAAWRDPSPSSPGIDLSGAPRPPVTGTVKMGTTLQHARDEALRSGAGEPRAGSHEFVTAPTHRSPQALATGALATGPLVTGPLVTGPLATGPFTTTPLATALLTTAARTGAPATTVLLATGPLVTAPSAAQGSLSQGAAHRGGAGVPALPAPSGLAALPAWLPAACIVAAVLVIGIVLVLLR